LPEIVWCNVPAGDFPYQRGEERTLPAFRVSKYLVTYRQFQAFINAEDGYSNATWWDGLHPEGIKQQHAGPSDQAFKFSNHPRECVSWYDAMAFCNWLSAKIGEPVTLPTGQQWEKAARGTDGRVYPYGNEFDSTKGNTDESRVGQTSAVGAFPDGVSPYGALDMSGNVWEWTLTEYDTGSEASVSTSGRRAARGGSWDIDQTGARVAFRGSYGPVYRGYDFGFRLATLRKTSEP
jgi:formylglycine-generating enzyme required for sulfatase activity